MTSVKNTSGLLGNSLAVILAGGKGDRLHPLTRDRSKPAVPFGGLYRIIDFTLSNCVNSGMRRVCLLTQYKSFSLERHIRVGWNIYREDLGEFITCIPPQHRISESWYRGTADAVYQNIYTIKNEQPNRVLILAGDHLYKMDYGFLLGNHYMNEADVTISCLEVSAAEATRFGVVRVSGDGRIREFEEKPKHPDRFTNPLGQCLASMGVYVFNTELLIEVLEQDSRDERSSHDFGKDIIPKLIPERRVYAYPYGERERGHSYWRDIGTLDAYWQAHMELMHPDPPLDLFETDWPIRTEMEQMPPARFMFRTGEGREQEGVFNSLIAPGCILRGGRIVNSVLSPGVEIFPGALIEDSVLFEDVKVGPGAHVRRAIVDKRHMVLEGDTVGVDLARDRQRYTVSEGGIAVIPKERIS